LPGLPRDLHRRRRRGHAAGRARLQGSGLRRHAHARPRAEDRGRHGGCAGLRVHVRLHQGPDPGRGRGGLRMGSSRREFLAGGAGAVLAAGAIVARAHADWQPSGRYPDPAIKILDPSFLKYRVNSAKVERLGTGYRWSEGPVWFGDGRYLLWSDIPNNRILKWEEETGAVSVYRKPSNFANGNTRDRQGRLVTCLHGGRSVIRTEYDGSVTTLIDSFDGKRLNSPNDVVVKSDGSIWFTDPTFGILADYEGYKATPEIDANVYRLEPGTHKPSIVAEGVLGPNGLCFSPDEKILYVVESRGVPNRKFVAFDVTDGGKKLANKRVFIDAGPGGTPDGMRCDVDGNLWC